MRELYAYRKTAKGFRVVKFDEDHSVLTAYELEVRRNWVRCQCFAANRETCRHREMLKLFVQHDRVDKGWFYEWNTGKWVRPLNQTRRRKA